MTEDNPVTVKFAPHLRRFIELPESCEATGLTVHDIVNQLEDRFPGVSNYLIHENGKLRKHVNVFLDDKMIVDREALSDCVKDVKQIFVMQALSGG